MAEIDGKICLPVELKAQKPLNRNAGWSKWPDK